MQVNFEWDENKNRINLEKHGIGFEYAARIFKGPHVVVRSNRTGEMRSAATGLLTDPRPRKPEQERLFTVIHTVRRGKTRIISARRARENEERAYRHVYP